MERQRPRNNGPSNKTKRSTKVRTNRVNRGDCRRPERNDYDVTCRRFPDFILVLQLDLPGPIRFASWFVSAKKMVYFWFLLFVWILLYIKGISFQTKPMSASPPWRLHNVRMSRPCHYLRFNLELFANRQSLYFGIDNLKVNTSTREYHNTFDWSITVIILHVFIII